MGRDYQRKIGSSFMNYTKENLRKALDGVKNGRKSLRRAAECYQIPKSTLYDKIKAHKTKKHGGQTIISPTDEEKLVNGITTLSEWCFPLTRSDIRVLVKNFLDRKGVKVAKFKDNYPGIEWFYKFVKRHKNILTERLAQNIKRVRAGITKEAITDYFENLRGIIENVPACNIVNYDESNLTDDPGRSKVLCRRGSKRVERIMDSSKSSISIMMAISASGALLPPYVVYKSVHLYPTWVEGGPIGTVYNRTKSGWFDGPTFDDWFDRILLPHFKTLRGKKVLIGDNLASHISLHVLQSCEDNDIHFVLLPPNATHLLQPLDVSFFAPFKKSWRSILTDWKFKNRGCISKSEFPRLLQQALEKVGNIENSIKSGFKSCGIFPLCPETVLKKIPDKEAENVVDQETNQHWINTLKEFLQDRRVTTTSSATKKRGKKVEVAPGKGISLKDLAGRSQSLSECRIENSDESDESIDVEYEDESSDQCDNTSDENEANPTDCDNDNQISDIDETDDRIDNVEVGNYILVRFTCPNNTSVKYYVGCVTDITIENNNVFLVNFLRKQSSAKMGYYFTYPVVRDESVIDQHQVVTILTKVIDLRRQKFQFPQIPKNIKVE